MSLFDYHLEQKGNDPVYTVNRFTINEQQKYLVPRAVAYSSSLLNYFFRGSLEVSLPEENVYALVDHSIENKKDIDGFKNIKVKIKNTTALRDVLGDPIIDEFGEVQVEPVVSGSLVAVVKFHRNNCYQPDLTGEWAAEPIGGCEFIGVDPLNCRTGEEEIVVSEAVTEFGDINGVEQEVVFDFTQSPVPINATDCSGQVNLATV